MAIKSSGIDHIHVDVRDLNKFIDLFTRLFECDHNQPLFVEEVQATTSMNNTFKLDVLQPNSPDSPIAKRMQEMGGEGVKALSFRVEDLEAAEAHARSCGLRVVSRVGYPGVMKQVQFDPADTFGFMLELVEYVPGHEEVIAEIKRKQRAGEL